MVKASISQTESKKRSQYSQCFCKYLYDKYDTLIQEAVFGAKKKMHQFSFHLVSIVTVKICLQNDKSVQ